MLGWCMNRMEKMKGAIRRYLDFSRIGIFILFLFLIRKHNSLCTAFLK